MKLQEPLYIGKKIMKNRLVVPPMALYGADAEGYVAPEKVEYYGALAQGGPGMVICEASAVGEALDWHRKPMRAFDEKIIPGYRKIVEAIHAAGALAVMQLYYPKDWPFEESVELAFQKSAIHCEQAGFDGIELHAAHGYLLSKATCCEGPDLLSRVYNAVREGVREDFIVGIRLGATDPDEESLLKTAKLLESADYLSISAGRLEGAGAQEPYIPGSWFQAAAKVKAIVSTPVFSVGHVRTGEDAERMLELGAADAICVGRGSLADYNFSKAVIHGEPFYRCYNCPECAWHGDRTLCPARMKAKRQAEKQLTMDN